MGGCDETFALAGACGPGPDGGRHRAGRKPSRSASCCRSAAPMPTSATRSTRRSISTSSCTPRTSRPYKVDIIKRDEGPPTGAVAKTVTTELITNDKVQLVTGFVFSPSAIALAPVITQAKVPMIIANAGTAWITNLSPYYRAAVVQHVAPGLSDGRLCVKTRSAARPRRSPIPTSRRARIRSRPSRPASRRPAAR